MESKNENKKQNQTMMVVLAILIVISFIGLIVGISLAFFTGQDTKKNTFTMGSIDISLTEPSWNEELSKKDLTPGQTLLKDPTVMETEGSSYTQMVVSFVSCNKKFDLTEDQVALLRDMIYYDKSYNINDEQTTKNLIKGSSYTKEELNNLVIDNKIEKMFNNEVFTVDEGNQTRTTFYYNYNNVLNKDERIVLFTNLVVPADYNQEEINLLTSYFNGEEYVACPKDSALKINVTANAIQSSNITKEEAFQELNKQK